MIQNQYIYNKAQTIRTKDRVEHFKQTTPDNHQAVIAYINQVQYKQSNGDWRNSGYRWAIVEPYLTEIEVIEWLLNNGQSTVGFLK